MSYELVFTRQAKKDAKKHKSTPLAAKAKELLRLIGISLLIKLILRSHLRSDRWSDETGTGHYQPSATQAAKAKTRTTAVTHQYHLIPIFRCGLALNSRAMNSS